MNPTAGPLGPAALQVLADAVLVLHVAIAGFVVLGLAVVPVGNAAGWRWVNDRRFRIAHLAAIGVVVAEAWLGVACPLTTLENALRRSAGAAGYGGGFIEHWLQRVLFYAAPGWVFVLGYSLFGLAVVAAWFRYPPRGRDREHASGRIDGADRPAKRRARCHDRRPPQGLA